MVRRQRCGVAAAPGACPASAAVVCCITLPQSYGCTAFLHDFLGANVTLLPLLPLPPTFLPSCADWTVPMARCLATALSWRPVPATPGRTRGTTRWVKRGTGGYSLSAVSKAAARGPASCRWRYTGRGRSEGRDLACCDMAGVGVGAVCSAGPWKGAAVGIKGQPSHCCEPILLAGGSHPLL